MPKKQRVDDKDRWSRFLTEKRYRGLSDEQRTRSDRHLGRVRDRVLRHAKVIVSKPTQKEPEPKQPTDEDQAPE